MPCVAYSGPGGRGTALDAAWAWGRHSGHPSPLDAAHGINDVGRDVRGRRHRQPIDAAHGINDVGRDFRGGRHLPSVDAAHGINGGGCEFRRRGT
jgi:hypothetical protein